METTNGLKSPSRSIGDIWTDYWKSKSEGEEDILIRNQLMENYLDLVKDCATRLHKKLPEGVQLDDLISSGIFGLMHAIKRFDPDRGIKFETYSVQGIRGAIFDELRQMDWIPRLTRQRAGQLNRAKDSFRKRLGRDPTLEEIQKELNVSTEDCRKIVNDSGGISMVPLHCRVKYEGVSENSFREVDVVDEGKVVDVDYEARRKELRHAMLHFLDRTQSLVVRLYHFEDYTMMEIGEILLLSESRVSQIRDEAIEIMKSKQELRALCKIE